MQNVQTVVSRSWDQLEPREGLSDEHVKVLLPQQRQAQTVERLVYHEVRVAIAVCAWRDRQTSPRGPRLGERMLCAMQHQMPKPAHTKHPMPKPACRLLAFLLLICTLHTKSLLAVDYYGEVPGSLLFMCLELSITHPPCDHTNPETS